MCLCNQWLPSAIVSGSQRRGFSNKDRIYFTTLIFVSLCVDVHTVCFVNFWFFLQLDEMQFDLRIMRKISCNLSCDTSFHAYLFSPYFSFRIVTFDIYQHHQWSTFLFIYFTLHLDIVFLIYEYKLFTVNTKCTCSGKWYHPYW